MLMSAENWGVLFPPPVSYLSTIQRGEVTEKKMKIPAFISGTGHTLGLRK
jgi:hypothetical protein